MKRIERRYGRTLCGECREAVDVRLFQLRLPCGHDVKKLAHEIETYEVTYAIANPCVTERRIS